MSKVITVETLAATLHVISKWEQPERYRHRAAAIFAALPAAPPDQPDALREGALKEALKEALLEVRGLLEPMTRMDSRREALLGVIDRALAASAAAGEGGEGS